MKKILPIFMIMLMMPFVANAQIASKAYVDEQDNTLIFGTTTPTSDQVSQLDDAGGVVGALDNAVRNIDDALGGAVNIRQNTNNALVVTNDNGFVSTATGGVIMDSNINDDAQIQLGKLAFPTPDDDCENDGCMLMYRDGQYVWELITRDTNEQISMTGAVDAEATSNPASVSTAAGATIGGGGCSSNSDCGPYESCNNGTCEGTAE